MNFKNLNSFVFFGGGTGLSRILKPFMLSDNIPHDSNISAIVSTFDNGGSSGILRSKHETPALVIYEKFCRHYLLKLILNF